MASDRVKRSGWLRSHTSRSVHARGGHAVLEAAAGDLDSCGRAYDHNSCHEGGIRPCPACMHSRRNS